MNEIPTKEEREYLRILSKAAFGSRGKWLKLSRDLGLTLESVQLQMEAIVKFRMEKLENVQSKESRSREATTDTTEPTSTSGSQQSDDVRSE